MEFAKWFTVKNLFDGMGLITIDPEQEVTFIYCTNDGQEYELMEQEISHRPYRSIFVDTNYYEDIPEDDEIVEHYSVRLIDEEFFDLHVRKIHLGSYRVNGFHTDSDINIFVEKL